MNFNELVAAVVTEIQRPDMGLVASGGDGRIPQAVLASTLKAHTYDYFFKDIATAQVKFDTAAYIQTLDTAGVPRYRNLAYFRKNDPTLATYQQNPLLLPPLVSGVDGLVPITLSMGFLEVLTPDNILDDFGAEKTDICYQAGSTVFVKSSTSLLWSLLGYYRYPNLDVTNNGGANFDSWVAREYPYAIVFDAASACLQKIGLTDAARKYDNPTNGLVTEQFGILQKNNVVAKGW